MFVDDVDETNDLPMAFSIIQTRRKQSCEGWI